jgi:phosphoribosylglycinamide formyltransferase 1
VSVPVAVFASGGGTNLQALLDSEYLAQRAHIALVVSDRAAAGAFDRAARHGVATRHIAVRDRTAEAVAEDTLNVLAEHAVKFIALAGYLRLVPPPVIRAFAGRIVNIHPALLPAFGGHGMYGMNVHRAVLAAGCRVTGVTVHRVTEAYDEGGILAQWPVPVLPGDSPEALAARVLAIEHLLYPIVIGRLLDHDSDDGLPGGPPGDVFRLGPAPSTETTYGDMLRVAGL